MIFHPSHFAHGPLSTENWWITWENNHLISFSDLLRGPSNNFSASSCYSLVGGWTNPFQKYARQIGSFPQIFGVKIKSIYLKPPPIFLSWVYPHLCPSIPVDFHPPEVLTRPAPSVVGSAAALFRPPPEEGCWTPRWCFLYKDLLKSFEAVLLYHPKKFYKGAPTIVINGVINPYEWPYKCVTGIISPLLVEVESYKPTCNYYLEDHPS